MTIRLRLATETRNPKTQNPEPETRNPKPGTQPATPVAVWVVRPKSEHCVNTTFHCVRATCAYPRRYGDPLATQRAGAVLP